MEKWFLFSLCSAGFAALVAVFGKIGLKDVDATAATTLRSLVMAAFLIVFVSFHGETAKISSILHEKKALLFIVLSGIAGALSWLCYFVALKFGPVAKVAPIDKLSVVFAVVLAFVFLGEKISILALCGVILISAGAVLIALA